MNGALKAAWGLTAFVVLGVLTGVGAAFALRPASDRPARKEGPAS